MKSIRNFISSIRFRMLVVYLLIILVVFFVVMFATMQVMTRTLVSETTSTTQASLNRIAYRLTSPAENNDITEIYNIIKQYAQQENGRVLVLDTNYIVKADSASLFNGYYLPYNEAIEVLENKATQAHGFHSLENPKTSEPEWITYYAQPLSANGLNSGVLFLSVSIQNVSNKITSLQKEMFYIFASVMVAFIILWFALMGKVLNPVVEITNIMRNATSKTFANKVEIKASGEVAELIDAFNRMGSELYAHDQIRDRFVADASHELKTPLASIKALSESVIYCENPPADLMLDFLKDINNQVDRLNNIVQDLLQVARDSSADVEYKMETLNFSEIVSELVHFITPVAQKKGLEMTMNVEPGIEIFGDKLRIERVVTNLIDNAIKYTETGSINVRLKHSGRDAVFCVKDTGIGIPEESIPRLFIRFYRVDKARSRATGGTGLGLSMVEEIVNRHSGNIKVESKLGEGSEFIVRIPLKK